MTSQFRRHQVKDPEPTLCRSAHPTSGRGPTQRRRDRLRLPRRAVLSSKESSMITGEGDRFGGQPLGQCEGGPVGQSTGGVRTGCQDDAGGGRTQRLGVVQRTVTIAPGRVGAQRPGLECSQTGSSPARWYVTPGGWRQHSMPWARAIPRSTPRVATATASARAQGLCSRRSYSALYIRGDIGVVQGLQFRLDPGHLLGHIGI